MLDLFFIIKSVLINSIPIKHFEEEDFLLLLAVSTELYNFLFLNISDNDVNPWNLIDKFYFILFIVIFY